MSISKKIVVALVIVASLGITVAVAALPERVTWEPNRLAPASIAPGESATYSLTLIHSGVLPITPTPQLRIVPEGEIAPFVTITPPNFPPVFKRGDRVSVQVKVAVPANTPLSVKKGELLLERILPNGKVMEVFRAEALPVELTFSPFPLPPDPGEAGKATIAGIDSNNNGVRDDVERWIGLNYGNSERTRRGLSSFAIGMQAAVLSPGNSTSALAASTTLDKALDCLWYIHGRTSIPMWQLLRAEYLNTADRSHAYSTYNRLLSGQAFANTGSAQLKARCDFDPDALPN